MRHAIFTCCLCAAAFLGGLSCAGTKVVTKTLPGETIVKEVPGPERIVEKVIHEPADTTELESLRTQLAASEEQLRYARGLLNQNAQKKSERQPVTPTYYQPRRRIFGGYR